MNAGNKYFRGGRYELAIKCYSEAIEYCPTENSLDLSTFHQNRAAAYDQMEVGACRVVYQKKPVLEPRDSQKIKFFRQLIKNCI